MDVSLGFSAGVMIAASFWSLLAPAIELAESSGLYGANGQYAFVPVAIGFLFGAIFVFATDKVITYLGINSASMMIQLTQSNKDKADIAMDEASIEHGKMISVGALNEHSLTIGMDSFADCLNSQHSGSTRKRRKKGGQASEQETYETESQNDLQNRVTSWKRIILLITAVTIHNIPGTCQISNNIWNDVNKFLVLEGLAVGVSFGAIGSTSKATFEAARNLAIGIGESLGSHQADHIFINLTLLQEFKTSQKGWQFHFHFTPADFHLQEASGMVN